MRTIQGEKQRTKEEKSSAICSSCGTVAVLDQVELQRALLGAIDRLFLGLMWVSVSAS
jgi:hypothetical protein